MKHWKFVALSALLLGVFSAFFTNCNSVRMEKLLPSSTDTISGNPIVAVQALAYTSAISNYRLCIENYQFGHGDVSVDVPGDTIERDVSPQSTIPLISGRVPVGSYTQLRLFLRNNCGTGSSFSFTNSGGDVSVSSEAVMLFNGAFEVTEAGISLSLQFEPFTDAFETAPSPDVALEIVNTTDGVIVP